MQKTIRFIPFVNDANNMNWRKNLEDKFTKDNIDLTTKINNIRNKKSTTDAKIYRDELHKIKKERQEKWVKYLMDETEKYFNVRCQAVADEWKRKGISEKDAVMVAALPEFYWCDINDNLKHMDGNNISTYIVGYHKPLYLEVINSIFKNKSNALYKLTDKYKNLIIFAGTVIWKEIKDNPFDELIYNTLFIYKNGEISNWSKRNISGIDGFFGTYGNCLKAKLGKGDSGKIGDIGQPLVEFNGIKFCFDICLDFSSGMVSNAQCPLSTALCTGKTDINVLISAGMPVNSYGLSTINSPVLLRCDGLSQPYGEILEKDNLAIIDSGINSVNGAEIAINV